MRQSPQDVPKTSQDGPKTLPRRPRLPRRPQDAPKTPPPDAPRRPPGRENFKLKNGFLADPLHRRSQDVPRLPRRPQDSPKTPPGRPQDAPRRAQDAFKTLPRSLQDASQDDLQHSSILGSVLGGLRGAKIVENVKRAAPKKNLLLA